MQGSQWIRSMSVVVTMVLGFVGSVAQVPVAKADEGLAFVMPPRQSKAESQRDYGPIATFFSQAIGRPVHLLYENNWLSFVEDMRKGRFDIVFDGPALTSWRMKHQQFVPLATLKGQLSFVIITRTDNPTIQNVKDLVGRTVCAFPPPNLATLSLYSLFDNPMAQPNVLPMKDIHAAYQGVIDKQCDAAVVQKLLYHKFNAGPTAGETRVIWTSAPMPNQGFSAGPRLTPGQIARLKAALLSPAGANATASMRAQFGNHPLIAANAAEFQGLDGLVRSTWGFGDQAQ